MAWADDVADIEAAMLALRPYGAQWNIIDSRSGRSLERSGCESRSCSTPTMAPW
jgi:hypothetical protein